MKNSWLFTALCALCLVWAKEVSYPLALIWVSAMAIFYIRHFQRHALFFLVMVWFLLPASKEVRPPESHIVQVQELHSSYAIAKSDSQQVLLYDVKRLAYGDVVAVDGAYQRIQGVHNFHQFYFPKWCARRGIFYGIRPKKVTVLSTGSGLRHELYVRLQTTIQDGKQRSLVNVMLYGIHEEDVSYFLCATGMHLVFVAGLLEKLLRKKLSTDHARIIVLLVLALSGYVTIFSSSLIRILCFRSMTLLFPKDHSQDLCGKRLLSVLLLAPYMAWEMSLLLTLSFSLWQLFSVHKHFYERWLLIVPFQFQYFHTCNPIQVLLFPVLRIGYGLLYICLLVSLLTSFPALCHMGLEAMEVLQKMEGWGIPLWYTPQLWWLVSWAFLFMAWIQRCHYKQVLRFVVLLLYAPCSSYLDPFGEILMVDVGQGDCTLLFLPYHKGVVMIDIMGSRYKNIPADIVVPIVQAKGYQAIDVLILTHDDFDHSGGEVQLKECLRVKQTIRKKQPYVDVQGVRIAFPLSTYQGKDANDDSILTYMQMYGLHVLCMGDAGIEAETVFLQEYDRLPVDVLKIGHHGSRTSSSQAFLHGINPSIALISSGRKNLYGHPHKEVLQTLHQENIHPLITAKDGAVSIRFTTRFAYYRTAENEVGILPLKRQEN